MDPLTHLSRKILLENNRQNPPQPPPPPYTSNNADDDSDDYNSDADSDDSDDSDETSPHPVNLTINAANSIQGSNNLVPTSPTPLADATKFSTLLLHAVNQINASAAASNGARRSVRVDLTINCGITVVGDRNVIGNVGLRPRHPPPFALAARPAGMAAGGDVGARGGVNAVVGAKRKVEEDSDDERENELGHEAKRVDLRHDDDDGALNS